MGCGSADSLLCAPNARPACAACDARAGEPGARRGRSRRAGRGDGGCAAPAPPCPAPRPRRRPPPRGGVRPPRQSFMDLDGKDVGYMNLYLRPNETSVFDGFCTHGACRRRPRRRAAAGCAPRAGRAPGARQAPPSPLTPAFPKRSQQGPQDVPALQVRKGRPGGRRPRGEHAVYPACAPQFGVPPVSCTPLSVPHTLVPRTPPPQQVTDPEQVRPHGPALQLQCAAGAAAAGWISSASTLRPASLLACPACATHIHTHTHSTHALN
jgi:hypothetical protein